MGQSSPVAARISELIGKYQPQVLVTYDDQGPYQHPDHVHASRSAQNAFAASASMAGGSVAKLYLSAMRGSDWRKIWDALRELGAEVPDWEEPDPERAHQKYLAMHRSDTNRSKIAIAERLMSSYDFSGKSVLEYGCGGGYFTIWMAKRGAHVTAIERNPNAIRGVNFYAAKDGVADRVRLLGAIPHHELPALYAASDVLVLASSREGWANVLLEAMAASLPAIATSVLAGRTAPK